MVANLLFKSSNGAPALLVVLPTSVLRSRPTFGGLINKVRLDDLREPEVAVVTIDSLEGRGMNSEMLLRALRKTVCGTTPSFCNSISPITLRFFPVSGSELSREEKLELDRSKARVKHVRPLKIEHTWLLH
jgi:hypothetical protein